MIIPEVYRCHLEEFQALWEHRHELFDSPDVTAADLGDWDSRIRDHLDGLLVPGEEAVGILKAALENSDLDVEFAAAYVLLRMNSMTAADVVMEALLRAEGDEIQKLERALCCGAIQGLEQRLVEAVESAAPTNAVAAAIVLAVQGQLAADIPRLEQFFEDEDPEVRQQAWRLAAIQDARAAAPSSKQP